MTTRSYLSIGDVLSLLREEFPDVTISKIRFLESQGLVNPERSPSGYRKFYDHDVERLRWVLRQQRENFLPLKVIRDRLSTDGTPVEEADAEPGAASAALATAGQEHAGANGMSQPAMAGAVRREEPAAHALTSRLAASSARPSGIAPALADREPRPTGRREPFDHEAIEPKAEATAAPPRTSAEAPTAPPTLASLPATARPPRAAEPSPSAPKHEAKPRAHKAEPATPARQAGAASVPAASKSGGFEISTGPSGATMTDDELAAAAGLSKADVTALESFGLISSNVVAGVVYYDEDALTVAKAAAHFGQFGIEPRHLRVYKNAVEREMGLIEQIITPLLRQRNPESRQRAIDASAEVAKLGQGLRAALLRREMRRQLGG